MAFVAPIVTGFSAAVSGSPVCRAPKTPTFSPRAATVTMKVSPSMPFMELPAPLEDDTIPGNVGFDPLYLSTSIDFAFLQEAEIKHCRIAMLGVLGWVVPELIRFPGVKAMSAPAAHDYFVSVGSMSQILLWSSFLEVFGLIALIETMRGGDRKPGDFCFDPLGFAKTPEALAKYRNAELVNGRLCMCAFGGFFHSWLLTKQGVIEQILNFKPLPGHIY